jgi:hypothetical protein
MKTKFTLVRPSVVTVGKFSFDGIQRIPVTLEQGKALLKWHSANKLPATLEFSEDDKEFIKIGWANENDQEWSWEVSQLNKLPLTKTST